MNVTLSLFAGVGAQFFDNNGTILSGGKIYTYAAGTTTPLATYTTASDSAFHTNPIVLDSAGRVPNGGEIWLNIGQGYKFVLKTSNDILIATYDNIPSSAQPPAANDANSIMYEQGYTVTAGSFVVGKSYRILSVGTTNFTLIGASANTSGVYFTATGVGTGTGTATLSRTVEAKLQDSISVKDFGAVGNGSTDDATAIQAAEDYASTNSLAVHFPAGTYICGTTIYRKGNTDWIGDGLQLSIVKYIGGSSVFDLINVPSASSEYSHIGFYNMGFDGNRSGSTNASAARNVILLERDASGGIDSPSSDIRFIGCKLFNFSYGGQGLHIKGYTNVQVKDSIFYDGGGASLYHPIYIRRCADVSITGNNSTGRDSNICIKVQSSPQSVVANNICQAGGQGILAQDAQSVTVVGNTIYNATFFGISSTIELLSSSNDVTVSGNTVYNSAGGIRLSNITVFAATGNNLSEFSTDGINCRAARDGSISGNTLSTSDAGGGTVKFINLEAGPSANRMGISGNTLRTSRASGTTYGIWTDEPVVSGIQLTVNSFSGTTWTEKHLGIEPVLYADPATGIAVGYDSRVFSTSLQEIHGTANVSGLPGYAAVNWRDANVAPSVALAKSRSGTIGTNSSTVINSDVLGSVIFYGDTNSSFLRGAQIDAVVDGTPSSDMPATINVRTTPAGSSTPVTRNKFKSNGSFNYVPMAQPSTAVAGDTYYDSGTNKLRCYNGSSWNDLF